ncbi:SRPBCC family protein [Robertkochia flava]|uniref:SRPBCC family protein n=1 Tax=Robertkochia flava TaxID=3447986 RepID=UPI001CCD1915|nr:SRPBCC family protein [Robertkochia marina]
MPVIELTTYIKSEIKVVFDLARSIDLHKISTEHTKEEAIAGKTEGLINLNESVTWKAKHLGITQLLTSKITEFNPPNSFTDEMVEGAFKSFKHQHIFESKDDGVLMTDIFEFQSPMGILGQLANSIFLKRYMKDLLEKRNEVIKEFAETEKWKSVLK